MTDAVIRLAFFRMLADREIARDAMALGNCPPGDPRVADDRYGRILLELTESLSSFPRDAAAAAGIAGIVSPPNALLPSLFTSGSGLHRRLKMIARLPLSPPRRSPLGPLLALILAGTTLSRAQGPAPAPNPDNPTKPASPATPAERQEDSPEERALKAPNPAVQEILDKTATEITFDGVALKDAVDFIRDATGANIFVNWKALESAGIDRGAPVTARLRNVKFSKAISVVLDSAGGKTKLGYQIDDGVLTITTADDLMHDVVTRVYDVRDLLVDSPDFDPKAAAGPATRPAVPGTRPASVPREEQINQVTRLIEDVVACDTWKDSGGPVGAIRELSGQLVITQTPENQATIARLLGQLREGRMTQVTVEARFISCDEQLYQTLLADWQKARATSTQRAATVEPPATQPGNPGAAFFLNDAQVTQFLRAAQESTGTSLIAAPRMTLHNGQRAYVQVSSQHSYVRDYSTVSMPDGQTRYDPVRATVDPGVVMDVQATASADRKFVTLTLRPKVSVLLGMKQAAWPSRPAGSTLVVDEPRMKSSELQTTCNVPDHGTLLLGGMEDPGIGSGIDSPAATQPADKPHYLFLLVKPSLIVQREAPEEQAPLSKTKINQ